MEYDLQLLPFNKNNPTGIGLYKLADQLSLDFKDFLPIVEAAQLLQFATIQQGDIDLTEIGHQFADASVLERKVLFREQLMKYVPIMEKIVWILQNKSNNKMEREFFVEIFEKRSTSVQKKPSINWIY